MSESFARTEGLFAHLRTQRADGIRICGRCRSARCGAGEGLHVAHANTPGAGAAGGLGFGLLSFAGARLEPGLEIFARYARLDERLKTAQRAITAEGAIDAQTLMGKGVGEIAERCQRFNVPCVAFAGVVTEPERARAKFSAVHALAPDFTSKEAAVGEPALWLERLAAKVARETP
jgi:glycerate kinase